LHVVDILFHDMKVNESFPFAISLAWKGSAPDAQDSGPDNQQSSLVFPKGNPIPSIKALTFYRSGTFSIDAQYSDVPGQQTPARISTYTVSQLTSLLISLVSIFYPLEVLLHF
jgi:heat shock protein 4